MCESDELHQAGEGGGLLDQGLHRLPLQNLAHCILQQLSTSRLFPSAAVKLLEFGNFLAAIRFLDHLQQTAGFNLHAVSGAYQQGWPEVFPWIFHLEHTLLICASGIPSRRLVCSCQLQLQG